MAEDVRAPEGPHTRREDPMSTILSCVRRGGVLLFLALSGLLAACGGGGGGSDSFSISFDRSSVSMGWTPGEPVNPAIVNVSVRGTPPGEIFLGAETPTGQPDPNIANLDVEILSATSARVVIMPNPSLPLGTYRGELVLLACLDATCNRQVAGSPFRVTYTITVADNIRVSTTLVGVVAEAAVPLSVPVQVGLPGGVASYTVTPSAPWMTVRDLTATGFTLDIAAQPAATTLSGQLTLTGGGYTRVVPVSITVGPRSLALDRSGSVSLNGVSGTPTDLRVNVLRLPEGQSAYTASTSNPEWATIVNQGADGFTVRAASLPEGTYFTTVRAQSGGAVREFQLVHVVSGGVPFRGLSLAQYSVTLMANEGTAGGSSTLGLVRPSWNPTVTTEVNYQLGNTVQWLTLDTLPDGDLRVSASARGLSAGTYVAGITLTPAYPAMPITAYVSLTVGQGMAVPAPLPITVTSDSTTGTLRGTVPVRFAVSEGGTWSATSATPWLRVLTPSGVQGEDIRVEVDAAQMLALEGWTTHQGLVRITGAIANPAQTLTPVDGQVLLRRELAEIQSVGPAQLIAGQPQQVLLRGRGFAALTDPAARLRVDGVAPASVAVTRVNDNAVRLSLPARAAGSVSVTAQPALAGAPSSSQTVSVLAPTTRPNWSTANVGGEIQAVVHSQALEAFFEVNKTTSAIVRTRWNGNAWVSDTLALPGLVNAALSPDGRLLVAALTSGGDAGNGSVRVIDGATLTEQGRYPAPFRPGAWSGHGALGLAVTTEGRVWISPDGSGWSFALQYFDLRTRSFGQLQSPLARDLYLGPWYTASRDGERLGIVQSSAISPQPPFLTMDASTDNLQVNPVGLSFHYEGTGWSDDASRFLWQGDVVYDREFNRVGSVRIPAADQQAGRFAMAGVISPDGRRAYFYDVPSDIFSNPDARPRIRVVDTSPAPGSVLDLPVLRTIELAAHAGCRDSNAPFYCLRPAMNITADGRTVVLAGHALRVMVDVSEDAAAPAKASRRLQTGVWRAAKPWKAQGR
jgi:hypothetical protein